jgi:hypothetical protein
MFCSNCGAKNKEHFSYCADCGTRQGNTSAPYAPATQTKFCSGCGGATAAAYCPECGKAATVITVGVSSAPAAKKTPDARALAAPSGEPIQDEFKGHNLFMNIAAIILIAGCFFNILATLSSNNWFWRHVSTGAISFWFVIVFLAGAGFVAADYFIRTEKKPLAVYTYAAMALAALIGSICIVAMLPYSAMHLLIIMISALIGIALILLKCYYIIGDVFPQLADGALRNINLPEMCAKINENYLTPINTVFLYAILISAPINAVLGTGFFPNFFLSASFLRSISFITILPSFILLLAAVGGTVFSKQAYKENVSTAFSASCGIAVCFVVLILFTSGNNLINLAGAALAGYAAYMLKNKHDVKLPSFSQPATTAATMASASPNLGAAVQSSTGAGSSGGAPHVTINITAPPPTPPAYSLNTSRGLLKFLLLSFITCGIYSIVYFSVISTDINIISSRYDGRKTMHYCLLMFLIGPITCGIAYFVWFHNLSNRVGNELRRRGVPYDFSAGTFWLWYILGSFIIIGPFVYIHKLSRAFNLLAENFNVNG